MKAIRCAAPNLLTVGMALAFYCVTVSLSLAQEQSAPAVSPGSSNHDSSEPLIKLGEFQDLALQSLRKELPRFSGIFASVHSCEIPNYGPLISIAIQPPPYYFTKPVLQELEKRQRAAEAQARKMRGEIEKAAQIISIRAKLADLEVERTSKRKNKTATNAVESQIQTLRRSLEELQGDDDVLIEKEILTVTEPISEVDLNKMMQENYKDLIEKVTVAMTNTLAENGTKLLNVDENDHICIATHIRNHFLGSKEKSIVFVLDGTDVQSYRSGLLDLPALKSKVTVKHEEK
jgi:hypothetical protein